MTVPTKIAATEASALAQAAAEAKRALAWTHTARFLTTATDLTSSDGNLTERAGERISGQADTSSTEYAS